MTEVSDANVLPNDNTVMFEVQLVADTKVQWLFAKKPGDSYWLQRLANEFLTLRYELDSNGVMRLGICDGNLDFEHCGTAQIRVTTRSLTLEVKDVTLVPLDRMKIIVDKAIAELRARIARLKP